ncbi:MAG: helix-turn-helix transcriptional regulator [Halanaeroarchaeum sp.]
MWAPRLAVALLAFSLLLAGVVVPAVGTSNAQATTTTENGTDVGPVERPATHTVVEIEVREDGDARWTVSSRFVVETDHERDAFETLVEDVTEGQSDPGYSPDTFRRAAALAANATGREMAIEDPTWTGEIRNDTGTLSLTFTWRNFAEVQGDRIAVGDAFSTEDGTWFPRLAEGQRLVVDPPSGYAPIDTPSDRGPVNGSLIWNGPQEFDPGYLSIAYVPSRGTSSPTPTTPANTTPGPGAQQTSPLFWLGIVLLVVAVGAGGYFYAAQRRGDGPTPGSGAGAATESRSDAGSPATPTESDDVTTKTPDETASPLQSETAGDVGAEATPVDAAGSAQDGEGDEGIDPALLSDEERVERLLERNGGRMKQAQIVKETGWSNAKVSQLLSSMAEEDRINKLRIGRENLITLPDEDVTDF